MTKLEELFKLNTLLNNEAEWQLHIAKTLVKNNPFIQAYENKLKEEGQKYPYINLDKDEFVKAVKTENELPHALINRDPKSGLWGYYYHSRYIGIDDYGVTYSSWNLDHDRESREAKAFLESQGIKFAGKGGDYKTMAKSISIKANTQNDSLYSLIACVTYLEVCVGTGLTTAELMKEVKTQYETTSQSEKTKIEAQIKQLKKELLQELQLEVGEKQPVETKPITTPTSDSTSKPLDPGQNDSWKDLYDKLNANYKKLNLDYKKIENNVSLLAKITSLEKTIGELEGDVTKLDNENKQLKINQEKHKPENLKPANLPKDWEKQIKEGNEWSDAFVGKKPLDLKDELGKLEIGKAQADQEKESAEQELRRWTSAFNEEIKAGKSPIDIKSDYDSFSRHSLTSEQKEAIKHYPEVKKHLKEWEKSFPSTMFHTPEQAGDAYRNALHSLNEWKLAFPLSKFPHKKPEDIRKDYNRLETGQKPGDHDQIKQDLETWTNAFSGSEFKGKSPSQIKSQLEQYKTGLLNEHHSDINRRLDDIIVTLLQKNVDKASLNSKYEKKHQKSIDEIMDTQLTLENWRTCLDNLKITLSICAAEKADEWGKEIDSMATDNEDRPNRIKNLVDFLSRINFLWKQTPKQAIKDNPFYLETFEQLGTYKNQMKSLSDKWTKHVTSRSIKWEDDSYIYEETETTYTTYVEQSLK